MPEMVIPSRRVRFKSEDDYVESTVLVIHPVFKLYAHVGWAFIRICA